MNENMDADMEKKVIDLRECKESITILLPLDFKRVHFSEYEGLDNEIGYYQGVGRVEISAVSDPFDLVPKSWEDVIESLNIMQPTTVGGLWHSLYSRQEEEAFMAFMALRISWNRWHSYLDEPKNGQYCYQIYYDNFASERFEVRKVTNPHGSLCFKEESHAMKFIECFPELLNKAKILL